MSGLIMAYHAWDVEAPTCSCCGATIGLTLAAAGLMDAMPTGSSAFDPGVSVSLPRCRLLAT
jgi:hypothetical protein